MQQLFHNGEVSADWKTAIDRSTHQVGGKRNPNNYRPITFSSLVCKVMDSIIYDNIVTKIENQEKTEEI